MRSEGKSIGRKYLFHSSLLTTHALTCFLLAACAVPHSLSRTIYEDPTNFVRVEIDPAVFPELPHTLHSHPAKLTADQMTRILRGFKIREHRVRFHILIAGEAEKEPVFREAEIKLLAPRLAEALARAEATERVTFYLSLPKTSIKREITTGGLYVREGHLHFILGNHRFNYGIPAYGMVYDRRYPMRPIAAKGFDLFFEPEEVVISKKYNFWDQVMGRVKDEMVIDLQRLFRSQIMAGLRSLLGARSMGKEGAAVLAGFEVDSRMNPHIFEEHCGSRSSHNPAVVLHAARDIIRPSRNPLEPEEADPVR